MRPPVRIATVTAVLCLASTAMAGEFFEKDGKALRGYDPVAYFTEMKPVKGEPAYTAAYKGSIFQFASQANRDAFAAAPDMYAPQYGGFCAYGMAKGYKAAIDPAAFTVVVGKLYLNYSGTVRALWLFNAKGFIEQADQNWPEVRKTTKVTE